MEPWLHLLHIASAVVWVGGGLMLFVTALRLRSVSEIVVLANFARTLPYVGLRVLMPAVIVLVLTGITLVFAEGGGDFSKLWIELALSIFAISLILGVVFLNRAATSFDRLVSEPVADLTAVRRALDRWSRLYAVVLVLLLLALWDMVFKPVL